jgi:hypothetical protein
MRTKFAMLASDVLQEFGGEWELHPVMDEGQHIVGTQAILTQEVMPRGEFSGMPSLFEHTHTAMVAFF